MIEHGEYVKGPIPSEGWAFGHDDIDTFGLRMGSDPDSVGLTVIPRTTRGNSVPSKPKLPGSILSQPIPHTIIDKHAELLCWTPRVIENSPSLYQTGAQESADILAAACKESFDYIQPSTATSLKRVPLLTRRGNVLIRDSKYTYLVLSNNKAAHSRMCRYQQVMSAVELQLVVPERLVGVDVLTLRRNSDRIGPEVEYVAANGKVLAYVFLDTFNTIDFDFLPGPWELDSRHTEWPNFGVLAAKLTNLAAADLTLYLNLVAS